MPVDLFGKLTKKMIYAMDQTKGPIEFHNMTSRITLDAIGLAGFGKCMIFCVCLADPTHSHTPFETRF